MTITKQRLDEFMFLRARENCSNDHKDEGHERDKRFYLEGANLLAPLLLEMVETLEKYRNVAGYDQRHSVTQFSEADVMLNKFEEFIK
jgi:hypothetical protein